MAGKLACACDGPAKAGWNVFAYQMLAQVAGQNPEASAALIEQARANQIPDSAWRKIATGLAGDQYQAGKIAADGSLISPVAPGLKTYHIESGNQNFYSVPLSSYATADQVQQRRTLLAQLTAVTTSAVGIEALQQAQASLSTLLAGP